MISVYLHRASYPFYFKYQQLNSQLFNQYQIRSHLFQFICILKKHYMSQTSKNSEEGNQNLNSSWFKQEEQVPKPRGNAENKARQTRRNYGQDNNNNEQAHSEKQKQKQDQNQIDLSIKEQSAKQAQEIHQPRNIQSKNFTKQSDKSTSSEKVWDELSYDKSDKKKPKSKKEKKQNEEKTQNKEKKGQQFPRILDQLKEEEKKQIKRKQKQENKYDALSTTICQKQISVEEKSIDLSWVVEKEQAQPTTKNTRGNRKVEPDRQQDNTPGRGNRRGNRQTSGNDFQRNEGFKKKNQYEEGGRPYQNSNNYNGGYNGGYNGYGGRGGRGGRGRENINYRQRREYGDNNNNYNRGGGNYDRDREDRDRDRGDQGSNYRDYNNNNNRFEKKQPYEHVNRNFQKRGGNYNRSENDFYQNRNRDRDRQYESNNNSNNYVLQNERKAKVMYEASEKKEEKVVVVKKQQQTPKTSSSQTKTLQILPRGQKCWPEMSMYVNETKLTFSYRQITEHQCDILIIPYKDLKLEMYPGNIVNKCKADYRKKILDKGAEIEELGHIYAQKCVGIPNFKAFGFLKMGKGVNEARPCIAGILPQLKQLSMPVFSILIPYSKQMGPAKDFIRAIIEGLGHYNGFTEVNISTNNAADFKLGLKSFSEEIESYMDDNKICIDY